MFDRHGYFFIATIVKKGNKYQSVSRAYVRAHAYRKFTFTRVREHICAVRLRNLQEMSIKQRVVKARTKMEQNEKKTHLSVKRRLTQEYVESRIPKTFHG